MTRIPVVFFAFLIFLVSCGDNTAATTETTTNTAADDSSDVEQANARATAAEGDSVWIYINHVKADKRQEFERFLHEVFFDSSSRLSDAEQKVFRQTRILHPTEAEKDGSYSYVFLMDPVVPGGQYDIEALMKKIYGDQKGADYMKQWGAMGVKEQTGYRLVQSRH